MSSNYIQGFKWHLPSAFNDSIAQCKFEQGDVLYKNKPSGENWREEIRDMDFMIQVKSPLRTDSAKGGEIDVFNYNWDSKITFEKIYPNDTSRNVIVETTQGAFYSFLWKDDESFITNNGLPLPVLTSVRPKFLNVDFLKSKVPIGSIGFAIIIDSVSNLIISKQLAIKNVLAKNYTFTSEIFACTDSISFTALSEKPNSGFSPTLGVELFLINSLNSAGIEDDIKSVLFKGIKNKFNINTHGLIIRN